MLYPSIANKGHSHFDSSTELLGVSTSFYPYPQKGDLRVPIAREW